MESVGLKLAPLTDNLRTVHKLPKTVNGVLITEVKKGGLAADKGLNAGDVIVEIDQQAVATPDDVAGKVAAAQKAGRNSVLFFIARGGDMRFIALKLKK